MIKKGFRSKGNNYLTPKKRTVYYRSYNNYGKYLVSLILIKHTSGDIKYVLTTQCYFIIINNELSVFLGI